MKKLGKYDIVRELGRGAMGVVYEARDPLIGRRVALKTITSGLSENPDLLERFKREAQAAGNLQHPNIVTIFELGEDKGTLYIAMEYLEGESLEQIIARKQNMSLLTKMNYFVQVCRGLGYAHERGVVHRDMKPANIMVMKDDTVKVVDFGIARLTAASSTKTGMMIGTVAYMSPEQVQGQHVDQRSDIWSVGVTFYELFSGNRPYSADNIAAVMFNIVTQDPKPLRDYIPDLPPDLEQLMNRIFQKKITERYQNFDDVLLDLEPVLKHLQQAGVSEMVEQAKRLMETSDLDRANDLLRQVIQIEPSNRGARELREKVRQEIARRAQAPQAQEHVNRAQQLLSQGKLAEAKSAVLDALRLDSHFLPAKDFMQRLEFSQMLESARQLKNEGRITEADATVTQILERDPSNTEAQQLRAQLSADRAGRERRRQLEDKKQKARALWTQQKFDECIAMLELMLGEYSGESEVSSFLETVRADKAEQERQAQIRQVRTLLGEHKFSEAIEICEQRLKLSPGDSVVQRLLEQVQLERKDHARRVRQQQEQQAIKKIVADGKYEEAIPRADVHLSEFPDDFEVRQLLDFARAQQAQEQQKRIRGEKLKLIQQLLEKQEFEGAVSEAESALVAVPGDEELQQLLKSAQAKAKEKKERETREFIQKQLTAMESAIERDDFSNAIDVGKRTMVAAGQNPDVTRLLQVAEEKREERRKKQEDEKAKDQLQTVYRQWKAGEVEEAKKALEDLSGTVVFNAQLQNLFNTVKEQKAPTETVFGQLGNFLEIKEPAGQGAADATRIFKAEAAAPPAPVSEEIKTTVPSKSLEDELTRTGPPVAEREFGKKKKKKDKGWRRTDDFEATTKWTEPIEADTPKAATPSVDFEATTKFSQPPPAASSAPPAAPPAADFGATTIGKIEDVVAPSKPAPPAADFGATTIGKVEDFIPPKPARPAPPPANFGATTIGKIEDVVAPQKAPPAADFGATTIGKIEDVVAPKKPATPAADFGATTIGKIDAMPVAPPEKREKEKKKARPTPALEEPARAEPRRAATAPAIEMPAPEVAPKTSSMGMIIGGVAAVAVVGVVLYFVLGKKPDATGPAAPSTSTSAPATSSGTSPGGGTVPPVNPAPAPVAAPPVDPWKTAEGKRVDGLIREARRLAGKSDFTGAMKKLDEAERVGGEPLVAEAIRSERNSIDKASKDTAYREAAKRDNDLLTQIANLRQKDTDDSLQQALGLVNTGINSNGPRAKDFSDLKPQIEQRISFVKAEGGRKTILDAGNQLARSGDWAGARAKARELQGAGGDAGALLTTITNAENAKKSQLDGMFDRFKNANNAGELEKLRAEYRKLVYEGGPLAGDARDIAENRIPAEITRINAPKAADPGPVGKAQPTQPASSCSASFKSMSPGYEAYKGALRSGQLLGENYIEGGLKLTASDVPAGIAQQACGKSVTLALNVDQSGKVTGGRVLGADPGFGKDLITAATQKWQFAPPKVSNTPVSTVGTIRVSFQ